MDEHLKQNYDQARRYLERLDPNAESFTFQTFDDNKNIGKNKSLTKILHGSLDELWDVLCHLNNQGAGIYTNVNRTDGKGRKIENIVGVRGVWQDADDPSCPELPLKPHMVVETSPDRFHRYVLVDGITPAEHQQAQRIMVENYGSDRNAADLARVLRVPGFFHMKNPEQPHMVKLISTTDDPPLSWQDLKDAFRIPADFGAGKELVPSAGLALATVPQSSISDLDLEDILNNFETHSGITPRRLYNAAMALPLGDYGSWLDCLASLHHEFNGGPEGLVLADHISSQKPGYAGLSDVQAKWNSFKRDEFSPGKVRTGASLVHNARKAVKIDQYDSEQPEAIISVFSELSKADQRSCRKKVSRRLGVSPEALDAAASRVMADNASNEC